MVDQIDNLVTELVQARNAAQARFVYANQQLSQDIRNRELAADVHELKLELDAAQMALDIHVQTNLQLKRDKRKRTLYCIIVDGEQLELLKDGLDSLQAVEDSSYEGLSQLEQRLDNINPGAHTINHLSDFIG